MVATLFELYHSRAVVAFSPSFLLGNLSQLLHRWVFWAFAGSVSFLVAHCADVVFAFRADAYLAAFLDAHVLWLYPLSAAFSRTVYPILCIILFELPVPSLLEIVVEEGLDVSQRDVLLLAASWRHMCGVFDGHLEDAL